MLRAESVTYSSVPQDESSVPPSTFTTSRSPYNPHSRRDCQLTAIITTIVIVTGLTLAATLPLIIKSSTSSKLPPTGNPDRLSNDNDSDLNLIIHLDGGEAQDTTEKISVNDYYNDEDYDFLYPQMKEPIVVVQTTEQPTVPRAPAVANVNTTIRAILTSKQPVQSVTEDVSGYVEDMAGRGTDYVAATIAKIVTPPPSEPGLVEGVNEDREPLAEGTQEENKQDADSENLDKYADNGDGSANQYIDTQTKITSKTEDDIDLEQLLSDIYGKEENVKPNSSDNDSWISDVIYTKDKVTLAILAAVVAVAGTTVVVAVVWLIYSRVSARRRRINIQNVITDLQSRDKIVLLNSEESEEE
ncbi:hypothetical protein SK128_000642 [Halocaridina rubra]|uniref:Uncharacterized protein n=1 Tax=Halocaridina rubra TaxID=373956 RepID=A0AAN8X5Q3_HALRR